MNNLLKKLNIKIKSIKIINNEKIIISNKNKFRVIENNNIKKDIYKYLENRNFLNFPKIYSKETDNFIICDYIEDENTNKEQKLTDMIYLITELHNKTIYYKEINLDDIKKIYEDQVNYLNYLSSYYMDLNLIIENETYMSPTNYLLIKNISYIYKVINIGIEYINKWYDEIKNKKTIKYTLNHNNLKINNFIENNGNFYLINWKNSDFGYNINDLINYYKNNYKEIELDTIINIYNSKLILEKYEYYYFISNLCNIKKLNLKNDFKNILEINKTIEYSKNIINYLSKNNSNKPNE